MHAVLQAARQWHEEIHFNAIITTDEASVISVGAVAQELGLPGVDIVGAQKSRNKYYMRIAHQEGKANYPAFKLCNSLDEALLAANEIKYPVIIKPTLGGNAEHVYLVNNENELRDRFPIAFKANLATSYCKHEAQTELLGPNSLLVEEFLNGSEHCVEAWIMDGHVAIGSIADRISIDSVTFDHDLYKTPTSLSDTQICSLYEALEKGVTAQKISHGVVHAEFRFHNGRPYIVEIAARVGGGSLYKMARISYGYCPITAAYMVANNLKPTCTVLKPTGEVAVGLTMLCAQGIVEDIEVPDEVKNHPGVFNLGILLKKGDINRRPPFGNDMLGYIGTTGKSVDAAVHLSETLFRKIAIKLKPYPEGS